MDWPPSDEKFVELLLSQFERELSMEEERVLFGLGVTLVPMPDGVFAYAPYLELGRELWSAMRFELYEVFCDSEKGEPRGWVHELLTGDLRNVMIGVVSAITAKYDVTLGIAIPVAALIVKERATTFCRHTPPLPIGRTAGEILVALHEDKARTDEQSRLNRSRLSGKRKRDH
jgi:hypothetical protein